MSEQAKPKSGRGGFRPGAGRKIKVKWIPPIDSAEVVEKIQKKVGRPCLFNPELHVRLATQFCKLAATDVEIADGLEITVATLYRWKSQFPEFCEALRVGKEEADARVERSLYSRANGYEHDEVDIRVVAGAIVKTPTRKFYPPDTIACIFWLKNRRRDLWRDKVDVEHGGDVNLRKMSDDDLRDKIAAGIEMIGEAPPGAAH